MAYPAKIVRLLHPQVECTLKKVRRSKHISLSVHQDGRVLVTAPYWESFRSMERFLGEQSEWLSKQLTRAHRAPRLVPHGNSAHYRAHRELARAFITQRLEFYNQYYGFTYNRVSIRNQRTRWGSCSENGNLNFSYKLFFLPQEFADYIIVHELCHLKELNHSSAFWKLVGRTFPNYRVLRRKLKNQVG